MSSEGGWEIPGATAMERAVRLAGALAESGVARVTLVFADGRRDECQARYTDLVGTLCAPGLTRLEAPGIVVEVRADRLRVGGQGAQRLVSAFAN